MRNKYNFKFLLLFAFVSACLIRCGTLGGISRTITFPVSMEKLELAIDSLYSLHPEYRIPRKWKALDDWEGRGYGFLKYRIFYFDSFPEEMYYVTFIGDSASLADTNAIAIGIRAVDNGTNRWLLAADLDRVEIKRISKRFDDEIVSRLEAYTGTKATHD